jgi:hypothetical protein
LARRGKAPCFGAPAIAEIGDLECSEAHSIAAGTATV